MLGIGEECKELVVKNALVVKNTSRKECTCQCRRHKRCRFDPQVGTIPWRREWQPTPVFLPEESHGQEEPGGL